MKKLEGFEGIVNTSWDTIQRCYEEYNQDNPDIIFHAEKKDEYAKLFEKYYIDIINRFMKEGTETLDSHKQAAIITICCLELNIIEHNIDDPNEISIVAQMIAVNAAFIFMTDCMNELLRKKWIKKKIEQYYFPVAIACDTPYYEIICRLLYYEQHEEDMKFNILELSDRYYLLEYINLLQRGIEPKLLKE